MADDIYSALIGEAPTSKEQQAALAAQLRRRRSFGELASFTGDRVLQPFGTNLATSADEYAGALQGIRQKDADNAQTQAYQTGQLDHMRAMEELTRRGQNLDHIYQMLMARAAMQKAEKTGNPKPSRLTYADRTKLEDVASMINQAGESSSGFQDDFTQRFGPGPQSRLSNTLASMGVATDEGKKASDWWAKWNLIYTLPQRNATFGATLTPGERQSWYESDINPSMDAQQVRERIKKITRILEQKGALINKTYSAQFDPELVAQYGLPTEEELSARDAAEQGAMADQMATPVPQPASTPSGPAPLTPEELQELQALRQRFGRNGP